MSPPTPGGHDQPLDPGRLELGPGALYRLSWRRPHVCDTLEPGSMVVMALEHVQEGVQNAAQVSGPDRCPRAG